MSLMRRDPFEALLPLREVMNRLFEESVVSPRFEMITSRSFPIDVYETEDQQKFIVEAALPGFKPEEVQITALGDTLTIRATRKQDEQVERGASYIRRERYEGEMSRSLTFPGPINVELVKATFERGLLILEVPKAETAKPRQIPIKIKEVAGTH